MIIRGTKLIHLPVTLIKVITDDKDERDIKKTSENTFENKTSNDRQSLKFRFVFAT